LGDRKAVPPNIRASVYAIALAEGGDAEFDAVLQEYLRATDADERNTALRALGRVKNPALIARTLTLPLSDQVKNQDIFMPLVGLRSESAGVDALWKWLTSNWDELVKRCPPGLTMLGLLVKICTSEFGSKEQLAMVEKFFADKDKTGYKMALEQSLDSIRARTGWVERDRDDVAAFLDKEGLLKANL